MRTILFPALALALTAMPIVPALAALAPNPPRANAVQFNDLDLESEAGKATLEGRIRNAARRVCDTEQRTGSRIASTACLEDVRQQVLARVEAYQNRTAKGG